MMRKAVAVAATAMAALLVVGTFDLAEARKGGRSGGIGKFHAGGIGGGRVRGLHSGKFYGGKIHSYKFAGSHHHGFRHKFRKRHVFIGGPLVYGAYAYGDGCYWLKKRAIRTGSSYWWNRYHNCRYGYGY